MKTFLYFYQITVKIIIPPLFQFKIKIKHTDKNQLLVMIISFSMFKLACIAHFGIIKTMLNQDLTNRLFFID